MRWFKARTLAIATPTVMPATDTTTMTIPGGEPASELLDQPVEDRLHVHAEQAKVAQDRNSVGAKP